MKVKDIVAALDLQVAAGEHALERDVTGGYVGDLLSCAMAGAQAGNVWITVQGHLNVVAVATLNELPAVIVTEGKPVSPETRVKAGEEGLALLTTGMAAYEVVGRLWELGVR